MLPLVFLPGAGGRATFWQPVAELLADLGPSLRLAWPGFGDVPADPTINSLDALLAWLLRWLPLGPVHIVAQSMGGVLAVRLAVEHPERVKTLVLCATSGGVDVAGMGGADWRPAYRAELPGVPDWFVVDRTDLTTRLGEIRAPTLILHGGADPICPPAVARLLEGRIPGARSIVVRGGAHAFGNERPEEVARAIHAHVTRSLITMDRPEWLQWVDALQTIASAGLTYSHDPFDRDRFEQVRKVAAEILSRHSDLSPPDAYERLRAEPGYVTPKVDVRAAVLDGDRVLLVREISDGRWSLPGGWADVGESPAEVAVREVREETGLEVQVARLLAVLDKRKHPHPPQLAYVYKLFFLCEETGGALRVSSETPDVGWFRRDALPPLSLDRVLPAQIERLFQQRDQPTLPADFD